MASTQHSERPSDAEDPSSKLSTEELYWRDRQEFLESRGYMLRPRYKRDWVPSWRGKPKGAVYKAEDGYRLPVSTDIGRMCLQK